MSKTIGKGTYKTVSLGTYTPPGGTTVNVAIAVAQMETQEEMVDMMKELEGQEMVSGAQIKYSGRVVVRGSDFVPRIFGYHKSTWVGEDEDEYGNVEEVTLPMITIAMDMWSGGDLWAEHKHPTALTQHWQQSLGVAFQTAIGVICSHSANIIHADLKPLNFLVNSDKTRVAITDFGFVNKEHDSDFWIKHNYRYWPQQDEKPAQSRNKFDVYGLGKTWQELKMDSVIGTPMHNIITNMMKRPHTRRFSMNQVMLGLVGIIKSKFEPEIAVEHGVRDKAQAALQQEAIEEQKLQAKKAESERIVAPSGRKKVRDTSTSRGSRVVPRHSQSTRDGFRPGPVIRASGPTRRSAYLSSRPRREDTSRVLSKIRVDGISQSSRPHQMEEAVKDDFPPWAVANGKGPMELRMQRMVDCAMLRSDPIHLIEALMSEQLV